MFCYRFIDKKLYLYDKDEPEVWFNYSDFDLGMREIIKQGIPKDQHKFIPDIFEV